MLSAPTGTKSNGDIVRMSYSPRVLGPFVKQSDWS
jgi:hypothetical protein